MVCCGVCVCDVSIWGCMWGVVRCACVYGVCMCVWVGGLCVCGGIHFIEIIYYVFGISHVYFLNCIIYNFHVMNSVIEIIDVI